MARPIQVLTPREFETLVDGWVPVRKIDQVHIHCTDRPRTSDFKGLTTIEAMRTYHQSIGMTDIAQHLTIDPNGLLWTGRPFDTMPASVRGHNGSAKAGPFMIEMVGLFDKGADAFRESQENAAYSVVCTILRKAELDENAVKFHREFPKTGKTCPGSALDPVAFRAEIKKALNKGTLRNFNTTVPRGMTRQPLDRAAVLESTQGPEAAYFEVPEGQRALLEQEFLASWIERGLLDPSQIAAPRDADEGYRALLPHVINTSQGILSRKGKLSTTPAEIDNLIEHHLTPAFDSGQCRHLLFYAHGGLVSEDAALECAKAMVPWWRSYGVYPIYFIWESSLFQAIWQRPRELERVRSRGIGDFFDGFVEGMTRKVARKIWKEMKANARRCSDQITEYEQPGGLYVFWQKLEPWLAKRKATIELHAVGHSTGPILLSRFMPMLINGKFEFSSLNYLAPAIRIDDFQSDVQRFLGAGKGIRQLRQYTMNDEAERNDDVALIYRKSLLYYVREACEDQTGGRILGLEKDLYANPAMRTLFGLKPAAGEPSAPSPQVGTPVATIEFSQDRHDFPKNGKTEATAHGAFDNDEATMTSVLAGILGKPSLIGGPVGEPFPSAEAFAAASEKDDLSRAVQERGEDTGFETSCCCCHEKREESPDQDAFGAEDVPEPAPSKGEGPSAGSGGGRGRKIALCVGINAYPRQPLNGCVKDSQNWAKALERQGFEVRTLRDQQATRAGLVSGLRKLIRDGKKGDQLVFQFAGHGTQVEDPTGDETDRFDEVVVPIDFDSGALLIDDDIYEFCKELRAGVGLTFFMDCCHSGTNTRFAPVIGAARRAGTQARYIRLDEKEVTAFKKVRKGRRSLAPGRERTALPGIVAFAACSDKEVAWEEEGQGNFSRHALSVFDSVLKSGGSNNDFIAAVRRQFAADKRQHPQLDKPAPGLEQAPFLGGF